jgi:hypothetical protein
VARRSSHAPAEAEAPEYAMRLAVILLIVAATVSSIGSNANSVFANRRIKFLALNGFCPSGRLLVLR